MAQYIVKFTLHPNVQAHFGYHGAGEVSPYVATFSNMAKARKEITEAVYGWRRYGSLRLGTVDYGRNSRGRRLAARWTATWNNDHTAMTLLYCSSRYIAGTLTLTKV